MGQPITNQARPTNQPTNQPTKNAVTGSEFVAKAVEVLKNNLENIETVSDWAESMNYSRPYFYSKFTNDTEVKPKACLRKTRYRYIRLAIDEYPFATSYAIAQEVGLKNDQCLYLFLSRNFDINFTELRKEVLNGNEETV